MTHRFFILLFSLFSLATFGQEKKEKTIKPVEIKENKEQQKAVLSTKTDTTKFNTKHIIQEVDSLKTNDLDLKFTLLKKKAHASYYHQKFHGRKTASGKKFDNTVYTAAHKKLPFGTKVKVTNEANGKSVIVEINDRGPFSKAREIDLTRKAFMDIADNKKAGVIFVTLEVVDEKEK